MNQISENIKRIQKERGLTNAQLAEMSGVNPGTLKAWFAKKADPNPTIKQLLGVADALGVGIDELVGKPESAAGKGSATCERQDEESEKEKLLKSVEGMGKAKIELINGIAAVIKGSGKAEL